MQKAHAETGCVNSALRLHLVMEQKLNSQSRIWDKANKSFRGLFNNFVVKVSRLKRMPKSWAFVLCQLGLWLIIFKNSLIAK